MKYILITVAALTISCDYNLKTDRELSQYNARIQDAENRMKANEAILTRFKDSMVLAHQKELKVRQRLQDSLIWADLPTVGCWQNDDHKHSCDAFP